MKSHLPIILVAALLSCTPPSSAGTDESKPDSARKEANASQTAGELPAPADVKAPPAHADKSVSGLASKVQQSGKALVVPATPPDVAAPPKDAHKSASGLAWKVQHKGTGDVHPTSADTVEVHYAGWTTDGKLFDNSYSRGETTTFPLRGVIKGWTEGLQHMVVGERTRFWIPANLAYGENPRAGAPKGMLVFDVELVGIKG